MTIWTIGHSTRAIEDLIAALKSQQIEVVADVRLFPSSRRYPQFNREMLKVSLHKEGIAYHHFQRLGGRRKARVDSHNLAWEHPAFRGYADYMETETFALAIQRLMMLAKQKRTAILCAEAVWWRCHRSLISDYLEVAGWTVLHIFDPNKTEKHPMTSAAQIVQGKLSYRGLI